MELKGVVLKTCHIPAENTSILIISAPKGFLACGYQNVETANNAGNACAIVTGVKSLKTC